MSQLTVNQLRLNNKGGVAFDRPLTRRSRKTLSPLFKVLRSMRNDSAHALETMFIYDGGVRYRTVKHLGAAVTGDLIDVCDARIQNRLGPQKRLQLQSRLPRLGVESINIRSVRAPANAFTVSLALDLPHEVRDEISCLQVLMPECQRRLSPFERLGLAFIQFNQQPEERLLEEVRTRVQNVDLPEEVSLQPLLIEAKR